MLRQILTCATAEGRIMSHAVRLAGAKATPLAAAGAMRASARAAAAVRPYSAMWVPLRSYGSGGSNTTATAKKSRAGGTSVNPDEGHRSCRDVAQAARTQVQRAPARDAEGRCLPGVIADVAATALELLPGAEEAARQKLERWEEAERNAVARSVYRSVVASNPSKRVRVTKKSIKIFAETQLHLLSCALGCRRGELLDKFFVKQCWWKSAKQYDPAAEERGLWELYLTLRDVGFPTDAAMIKLLADLKKAKSLRFNAAGHDPEYAEDYAIPPAAAYDFFHRLLRYVPRLWWLRFSHLPPLSSPGALQALAGDARASQSLTFLHTDYTVADLLAISGRCPWLSLLRVHTSHCTDWGKYAAIADMDERKRSVNKTCRVTISWEEK